MWLKILCLMMIAGDAIAVDDFLSHLYGLEQRNKMLVCLKPTATMHGRECTGALLHDQWVGVRAGCLRIHPLNHILVLRPLIAGETCDAITKRYSSRYSRAVRAVFHHPWADLAMVNVDTPYFNLDKHPNSTKWTVPRAFKRHGTWKWMKKYIDESELQRDPYRYYTMLQQTMISNRSPLLVMLLTIVLPILALILVFFYVINYTGSSSKTSYKDWKDLKYTRKETRV